MPISRLVAVSLRPASSVFRRTLARTGSVERVETARLTTDRPRARFSCMTESFTWGTPAQRESPLGRVAARSAVRSIAARGSVCLCSYLPPIFSPRHHRRNGVDDVDGRAWPCGKSSWTRRRRRWTIRPDTRGRRRTGRGRPPGAAATTRENAETLHAPACGCARRLGPVSTTGRRSPPIQGPCPQRDDEDAAPSRGGIASPYHGPRCAKRERPLDQ